MKEDESFMLKCKFSKPLKRFFKKKRLYEPLKQNEREFIMYICIYLSPERDV